MEVLKKKNYKKKTDELPVILKFYLIYIICLYIVMYVHYICFFLKVYLTSTNSDPKNLNLHITLTLYY